MANDNDDHGQPSTSTASTTTNQRKIKKHLPLVNRSTSEIVRTYQKRFDSTIDDYNDDDDNHNHNNDKRKQQQRSFDETFIIEDNVDGKMINYNNNNRIKTNRPPNSRWKQQRLPAWQPILKPTSVLISFILFGLFCIVIGVVMFISNQKIQEIIIDYTDCHRINPITNINQCEYCRDRWKFKWENCECLLNFTITESIDGPLFLYYSLNGFYQNHRRYVASIDRRQLMGEKRSLEQIRSDCYPYSDIDGKIIAPCGAIANSMFSDTFQLRRIVQNNHDDQPEKIHIWEKDISWPTDRQNLYQNPSDDNFQSYAKPINWSQNLYDDTILNKQNEAGFGYINEHFMVWMRPAAFPIFRKLWGRIDCRSLNNNNNIDQLPKGSYQLLINYDYQTVTDHLRISKKVIISNMSWMGGKNSFLSILYMVVGIILILIAIIFIIIFPKIKSNDNIDICQQHNHQNLPTNSEQNQQQEPEIKNNFQYYHSTSQS